MALVQVLEKTGDIDGKFIKWQVLSITGYLEGLPYTLEVKVDKTQAMLAKMLLSTKETSLDVKVTTGGDVAVKRVSKDDEMDDFLNGLE